MEFVKVTFPTDLVVYIDGEENGSTNEVLRVEPGTHVFELSKVAAYRPTARKVTVQDTTPLEPLEIVFFRKDD
jgi:PEGA domain